MSLDNMIISIKDFIIIVVKIKALTYFQVTKLN